MTRPTMMQYFEWYLPADGKHWENLKNDAIHLKEIGISHIWMPPAFKATGKEDVGYGIYDLFDLGEFDQKGTVPTKYGTKKDYIAAIQALQEQGIVTIADIVLNHKMGADGTEIVNAKEVNRQNTNEIISDDEQIEVYSLFTFPGRNKKYSDFIDNIGLRISFR